MAVERASTSRLNALAVYAFALAIAWLPGHTCVASAIDVAKAQSSPLRFTTAAHMRVPLNSPPASPPCDGAATRSCLSCPAEGTPEQFAALSWACAPAVARPQRRRAGAASNSLVGFITPPVLRGTGERRSGARAKTWGGAATTPTRTGGFHPCSRRTEQQGWGDLWPSPNAGPR